MSASATPTSTTDPVDEVFQSQPQLATLMDAMNTLLLSFVNIKSQDITLVQKSYAAFITTVKPILSTPTLYRYVVYETLLFTGQCAAEHWSIPYAQPADTKQHWKALLINALLIVSDLPKPLQEAKARLSKIASPLVKYTAMMQRPISGTRRLIRFNNITAQMEHELAALVLGNVDPAGFQSQYEAAAIVVFAHTRNLLYFILLDPTTQPKVKTLAGTADIDAKTHLVCAAADNILDICFTTPGSVHSEMFTINWPTPRYSLPI
jgi:hypothetical protein